MHPLHTFEGAGVQMWIMYRVGGKLRVIVYKLYISVVYKPRVLSWNTASRRCYHKLISLQSCLFSSTLTERAVFVSLFHSVCLIRSLRSFPFCFVFFYWSFLEGGFDILYICSHFLVSRGVAILDWSGCGRGLLCWMLRKGEFTWIQFFILNWDRYMQDWISFKNGRKKANKD